MNKILRIGFMGTPDFALAALKAIDESEHDVVVVYSQPPRPKGRGHKIQPSSVHEYAKSQGISVLTPVSVKTTEAQAEFAAHRLDIAIVAAYGLILPKAILEAPKYGCLNIHASLLPRWRGASPIQQAIWHGDKETGISIMQMDEGLDTGPVIAKESVAISNKTTATLLHDELATLGGRMIVDALSNIPLSVAPQDESKVTYAPLLKKEDGRIDWSASAVEIDRQIRALNPWPGVFTEAGGARLKVLDSEVVNQTKEAEPGPGTILNRDGDILCGDGSVLRIKKIQPHGSKSMDFASALNGNHLKLGWRF